LPQVQGQLGVYNDLHTKKLFQKKKKKRTGDVAQLREFLPIMHEALCLIHHTLQKQACRHVGAYLQSQHSGGTGKKIKSSGHLWLHSEFEASLQW
jgi:hypothetical protein